MAVCNPQSVEKQTTLPETEQPADNVVAHAISAGIPATSLPAVLVLAEADTMTSVAQWADMQQKRERAHGRKPLKAETQQTLAAAGNSISSVWRNVKTP